ncbi:MAG: hypothetical protein KAJ24_07465 [Candidatus Aenigmarchaeota archaeon]|nr:hypothetical protein [Candidatus Aenigmarchaeota archaeon]
MTVLTGINSGKIDRLIEVGFCDVKIKTEYELRRLSGPATVILYKSGKLLVQGKETEVERVVFFLTGKTAAKKVVPKTEGGKIVRIGSDESLKGDTFGGIVVASAKLGPKEREALAKCGVQDSKKIMNSKIHELAAEIKKVLGRKNYAIVELLPEEYNKFKSVTAMLNAMHSRATNSLLPAYEIVVDQYPGCRVKGAILETKAESKYLSVAAASILARSVALRQIDELSKKAGFKVPLGSTHVRGALAELKKRGLAPEKFVKTGFRNVQKIFC